MLWRRTGAGASSSRDRRARSLRSPPPRGLAEVDWDCDWEAEAPAACLRGDLCGAGGSWLPWLPCWLPPPSLGRLRRCASLRCSLRCVACLGSGSEVGLGLGLGVEVLGLARLVGVRIRVRVRATSCRIAGRGSLPFWRRLRDASPSRFAGRGSSSSSSCVAECGQSVGRRGGGRGGQGARWWWCRGVRRERRDQEAGCRGRGLRRPRARTQCRAQGAGRRVQGAGRRAQGAGCRAQGAGRRAQGARAHLQYREDRIPAEVCTEHGGDARCA